MKVKRLLGSLAAAGMLTTASFAFSAAAWASGVTVSITSPANAQPAQGTIQVNASATCSDLACNITSMSGVITNSSGHVVASGSSTSSGLSFAWNSSPATNGTYQVQVSAEESSDLGLNSGSGSNSVTTKVNNAPSAPTGVNATIGSGGVPVVTWNPNPEADITGYEVFRSGSTAASAASFTTAGNVTSFTDSGAPTGIPLSYIVVAVRSSPVWSSGITSCGGQAPCSSPPTSAETTAVTVPTPTPTPAPSSVATADPAKSAGSTAAGGTTSTTTTSTARQPLVFVAGKPKALSGPQSATTYVQQAEPNVVQFAPLLPYSGKIPVLNVTGTVPAPVQAGSGGAAGTTVALPGLGTVTRVNAIRYVAAAMLLIVAAFHVTRFARKLTRGI
jgi:hypothetical protein